MEELFTIRETAEKLKISVSSMYRDIEAGCFPHRRIGSNIRLTNADIEAFLSREANKGDAAVKPSGKTGKGRQPGRNRHDTV